MHNIQNIAQEKTKQLLNHHISNKAFRFTAALCAAATLIGGVAYAATPDVAVSEEPLAAETTEANFTDDVITVYNENDFESSDLVRLKTPVDGTAISLVVINNKMDAALELQNRIPCGWPVESRIVSTEFNPTADPSISDGRKHEGMDISTRSKIIPISATATGTVVTANYHRQYGYQVIIDHGNGFTTLYAHCNELMVNAGDEVKKGDVVATTGSSGWSTGIHCHYEVMLNGEYQNPRDYL